MRLQPEPSGIPRMVRGAQFGVATLVVSTAAHVLGGGAVPDPLVLVALAVPLGLVCERLSRRRRGAAAYVVALAAVQVVLHEGLMLGAPMCGGAMVVSAGHHGGHGVIIPMADAGACSATTMSTPWMLVAHAVATVLLALVLAHGEQQVLLLAHAVALLLGRPLEAVPVLPARARILTAAQTPVVSHDPGRLVSRRGPPAVLRHA